MIPIILAASVAFVFSASVRAQVTPARGYEPVDDTPLVKVGGTIFADYTYQGRPTTTDSDNNAVHSSAFNVGRSYINLTGNISHLIAYRITPDISRETGTGSSLSGSYTFRLKYAYGQINFDEWTGKGSWLRLGLQQTPFIDFEEGIYRYRFQGPVFVDREGFMTSSDNGASLHYNIPMNYGEIHLGVYNGEGYSKAESNNQKAIQIRGTLRPAPAVPELRGLRVTVFYDADHYVKSAKKDRFVANLTFEHPWINAGFEYLDAKDQNASASKPVIEAQGWSAWATPRTAFGLEALFRYDSLKPNKQVNAKKKRTIAGVAYWFPVMKGVSSALLADYEQVSYDLALNKPKEQRYALHALFNF
jgi:hypothetical protein